MRFTSLPQAAPFPSLSDFRASFVLQLRENGSKIPQQQSWGLRMLRAAAGEFGAEMQAGRRRMAWTPGDEGCTDAGGSPRLVGRRGPGAGGRWQGRSLRERLCSRASRESAKASGFQHFSSTSLLLCTGAGPRWSTAGWSGSPRKAGDGHAFSP